MPRSTFQLPPEILSLILQRLPLRRDLFQCLLASRQVKGEVERILDRDIRIYFNPGRDFPPRLSLESLFHNEARTEHIRSLSFHTDYRTADLVRLALENAVNLVALTLHFTDLTHEGDPDRGSEVIPIATPTVPLAPLPGLVARPIRISRQRIVTPFSLYVPLEPEFELKYFETDHPGDDSHSLERFIGSQPNITHVGPFPYRSPLSIALFPNIVALSSGSPEAILDFGIGRKIRALDCHARLGDLMHVMLEKRLNPLCLPSIMSLSFENWPDLELLVRLFPNAIYLQVFARSPERPESFRSTFKHLQRIRTSWILPISSLISDFFVWFPSLQVLEVFDKEDVYVTVWVRNPEGDVVRSREEVARADEWSAWFM